MRLSIPLLMGVSGLLLSARAANFDLKVVDKEAPPEVAPAIRTQLQAKAIQLVQGGKPVYEFWLNRELPLKSKPASAAQGLASIKETTLLGAVVVSKAERDYRDDEVYEGVYTMRFAMQPQDGNHLGSAEFPYFAILVPTKLDTALDTFADQKAMVKASGMETATGHPTVLSLRPSASDEGESPRLDEPLPDHKTLLFKLPAKASDDGAKLDVVFEIVYKGTGHL